MIVSSEVKDALSKGKPNQILGLTNDEIIEYANLAIEAIIKARTNKWASAVAVGSMVWGLGKKAKANITAIQESKKYVLLISEEEGRLYSFVSNLSFQQSSSEEKRVLEAILLSRNSSYAFDDDAADEEDEDSSDMVSSAGRRILLSNSAAGVQSLVYKDITFVVHKQNAEPVSQMMVTQGDGSSFAVAPTANNRNAIPVGRYRLIFETEVDRQKFIDYADEYVQSLEPLRARLMVQGSWGGFHEMSDVPRRKVESVILHDGQMDRIITHLKKFADNESKYADMGIPWHTGVLFYGPPGTGKSSLAVALANTLDYDIYSISLTSVKDDNMLTELMARVDSRSIVLLEDIDVASAATKSTDDTRGVTKQGLLNVLDGATSPHGTVFIMTTNHADKIQTELLRSGRVDMREYIGYLTQDQAEKICEQFMGHVPAGLPAISESDCITPAKLISVFRDNMDDLENADDQIIQLITNEKIKEMEVNA